jgi:hypothetical protein
MLLAIEVKKEFDSSTLYDGAGSVVAKIKNIQPLILTKELFDKIQPGEVFRIITTNLQNVDDSFNTYLKFVCKKGEGYDWAIYCHKPEKSDLYITTYGNKVRGLETILSICPCDDDVLKLYRH